MGPSSWDGTPGSNRLPIVSFLLRGHTRRERITEFTNQECLRCIRRPFPIGDIVVLVYIEAKLLGSLVWSAWVIWSCEVHRLC